MTHPGNAAPDLETLAQAAYLAYLEGNPDRPLTGPAWDALPESQRVQWRMVADAVQMLIDLRRTPLQDGL